MSRKTIIAAAAPLLFFSGLIAWGVDFLLYADRPLGNDSRQKKVFISSGDGFGDATEKLHRAGLIASPAKFKLLALLKGCDKQIKAGEYFLSAAMSPLQLLETMVKGRVHLYKLIIPEGYTMHQIAERVAESGIGGEKPFLEAASDPALLSELGIEAETCEGYLFPDTYLFPKGVSPRVIISTMVYQLRSFFTPEWKQQAETLGFSNHEIITLASIIEKEAGVAEERPIISSVFHNRLKLRMRLESDPTAIYGVEDFAGRITRRHLTTPTPYNTYTIYGLPPGPIANPGRGALEAALYPAETEFLFFVSKNDSTHQFSRDLKSHNRAVRRYQRPQKSGG